MEELRLSHAHPGLSSCLLSIPSSHSASWSPYQTKWSPKRTERDSISVCVCVCVSRLSDDLSHYLAKPCNMVALDFQMLPSVVTLPQHKQSQSVMMRLYCQSTFKIQGQSHSCGPTPLQDKSVSSSFQISRTEILKAIYYCNVIPHLRFTQ